MVLKLKNSVPGTKGVAQRIPPKKGGRSRKDEADRFINDDINEPPLRKTSGKTSGKTTGKTTGKTHSKSLLDDATSSFKATASGNAYEPEPTNDHDGLDLDANGEAELRTDNTPAGLFSPDEGESWDIRSPDHTSSSSVSFKFEESVPARQLDTPPARDLEGLFTPDAPQVTLSKKVSTRFESDFGENVPDSAHEDNYTGPEVIAIVVKTVVPCYIVQMPKEVRARIYSYVLFPKGKENGPRPFFSNTSNWQLKPPAMLQLCQQIRNEATGPYYHSYIVGGASVQKVLPWLKTLSPQARGALGKIKLPFINNDHVNKTKEQQIAACLKQFKKARVEIPRRKLKLVVQPQDVKRSEGGDLTDEE
ncbi:uncharacterized protein RCC_09741 [Ramularia collo-cygni]|uniref:Uncharacterized protein n=1 Tax=Ramularia collo-cygni TaxID=112498 RepID=A0A2D3VML8_9PEZI|nr:uncharacterized protein RCC_09741 [Ramularia collo-cygni]CZT24024.1 uncharacterized protein RCC_09741 [Ramularia collo-cygni]